MNFEIKKFILKNPPRKTVIFDHFNHIDFMKWEAVIFGG